MPTNDYEPHPFINHVPCPPWPRSVHTDALDAINEQFGGVIKPDTKLPGLLPLTIRQNCTECGFHIPCHKHSQLMRLMYDTGIISRQGCKADNRTFKSSDSDS